MTGFDAIIVGAGPAGAACAIILARSGIRVMLCDRARFPRHKICGDCLNPRAWQLFDILGVDEALRRLQMRTIAAIRITAANGVELKMTYENDATSPFVSISRAQLDNILLQKAGKVGAVVFEEVTVRDITAHNGKWRVHTEPDDKQADGHYLADIIIGADGRNSLVAKRADGAQTNEPASGRKRVGIQWHTRFQPAIGSDIELFITPVGYFGVVNINDGLANLAMVTSPDMIQYAQRNIAGFITLLTNSNPGLQRRSIVLTPESSISSAFPVTPKRRQSKLKNVYLIGDAAQTVEPFTGEGVLLALQDGIRTGYRIVQSRFSDAQTVMIHGHSPLWANRFFSPVLQRSSWSNILIPLAVKYPSMADAVMRLVLPPAHK